MIKQNAKDVEENLDILMGNAAPVAKELAAMACKQLKGWTNSGLMGQKSINQIG